MNKIDKVNFVKSPENINGVKVVNDESSALSELLKGNTITRFEYGNSMSPILNNGQYAVLKPITDTNLINIGDAVFCEVNGYLMTHMVIMKSNSSSGKPLFLIGSSHFEVYGWTDKIYAIAKGIDYFEENSLKDTFSNVEEI